MILNSDQSTQRIPAKASVFGATPVWKATFTACGPSTVVGELSLVVVKVLPGTPASAKGRVSVVLKSNWTFEK